MAMEKQKRNQRQIYCGQHLPFISNLNTFFLAYIAGYCCFNKMSTSSINRRLLRASASFIKLAPSWTQTR